MAESKKETIERLRDELFRTQGELGRLRSANSHYQHAENARRAAEVKAAQREQDRKRREAERKRLDDLASGLVDVASADVSIHWDKGAEPTVSIELKLPRREAEVLNDFIVTRDKPVSTPHLHMYLPDWSSLRQTVLAGGRIR
jgi:chromatin segregation and condensation protein Rec8/ScpA/Scc1 (kleisin family)